MAKGMKRKSVSGATLGGGADGSATKRRPNRGAGGNDGSDGSGDEAGPSGAGATVGSMTSRIGNKMVRGELYAKLKKIKQVRREACDMFSFTATSAATS
jgi:hypothetical protein